jgi:hypothetical protein
MHDATKDLRMTSLARESFDGVWAGEGLGAFPIEEAQRVIAAFFRALKPRVGVLFVGHRYSTTGFESLLRQNGFQVIHQGRQAGGASEPWNAVTSRRI